MLSAIWAERKRELAVDFTISIRRSPHGPCQLELYSSFRPKCQNNVNLIMLIHWQGVCVYPADVWGLIRTSLLQFIIFRSSPSFILFQGLEMIPNWCQRREKSENGKFTIKSTFPRAKQPVDCETTCLGGLKMVALETCACSQSEASVDLYAVYSQTGVIGVRSDRVDLLNRQVTRRGHCTTHVLRDRQLAANHPSTVLSRARGREKK